MRVLYLCRHCHHQVGALNRPAWSEQDADLMCGFSQLPRGQRSESVAYHEQTGDVYVSVVCENCQQALEDNPELLIEGKLLQ